MKPFRKTSWKNPRYMKFKITCLFCSSDSMVVRSEAKFCSRECWKQYIIGENNHEWKGVNRSERQKTRIGGTTMMKHRYVAQKSIGRLLKKEEVVHHIDCNDRNNSEDNLYVFRHTAAHARWHRFLRRHKLDGRILKSNLPDLCAQAV